MLASNRVSIVVTSDKLRVYEYFPTLTAMLRQIKVPYYFVRLKDSQELIRIICLKENIEKVKSVISNQKLVIWQNPQPYEVNYMRYGNEAVYSSVEAYFYFINKCYSKYGQESNLFQRYLHILNVILHVFSIKETEYSILLELLIDLWSEYYNISNEDLKLLEHQLNIKYNIDNQLLEKEDLKMCKQYLKEIKLIINITKCPINGEFPSFSKNLREYLLKQDFVLQQEIKLLVTLFHMTANMFGIHSHLEIYSYLILNKGLSNNDRIYTK